MVVSRSRTMHRQSPLLTIGGTVLKESDDLVILWVTFDSKMTVEKYLRSVSIAASQRLGILRKSWWVFHDRSLLGRCFRGFFLPVLDYCSAVWCSAADTHLKLLDRAVSGARFLTGGVFECDIAHRRSVAVLLYAYKIRCKAMRPLNGALPSPYAPVRVIHGALVTHRYTYAPPRCRTSQTAGLLFPSRCPCRMILLTPYWMVWDWRVSRVGPMLFYWPKMLYPFYLLLFFSSLLSVYRLVLWSWGLRTNRVYITLFQHCTADLF